ncbi:hypothetical protein WJX81_008036 [Elliptochloris bilobata]|uniref:Divalent metal cation transporter MntH n=1 Tax=Elliptochloris bilobata TaxID=381761 RepID=A0AAW1RXL7_9CHLO
MAPASEASTSSSEGGADAPEDVELLKGWRVNDGVPSLPEINGTIAVPVASRPWFAQLAAFAGVGSMISVGYMDPGNWATDLQGGAQYGYTLLVVVLLSNLLAMFLQSLSLRLGIVSERDLAQACRDAYPKWVTYGLWLVLEVAIAATDLAEVIGSATAIYLLSNGVVPLWAGVLITAVDVLVILIMGTRNFRALELLVATLIALIAGIFAYELARVKPDWLLVAKGLIPDPIIIRDPGMLYVAIGILGATVMPHNIVLHSSLIQTRGYPRTTAGKRMAVRYGTWDSCLSLCAAFFVNAAILVLAAAAFHYGTNPRPDIAGIADAYELLAPALGSHAARILFGVALLACGQNSAITGTLAGQIVMEGMLSIRLRPWVRRMFTRTLAIVPAAIVAGVYGAAGAGRLLILSQVILSLTLSFAVVPLVHFTGSRAKMGSFVSSLPTRVIAAVLAVIIAGVNAYLIVSGIINNTFATASS